MSGGYLARLGLRAGSGARTGGGGGVEPGASGGIAALRPDPWRGRQGPGGEGAGAFDPGDAFRLAANLPVGNGDGAPGAGSPWHTTLSPAAQAVTGQREPSSRLLAGRLARLSSGFSPASLRAASSGAVRHGVLPPGQLSALVETGPARFADSEPAGDGLSSPAGLPRQASRDGVTVPMVTLDAATMPSRQRSHGDAGRADSLPSPDAATGLVALTAQALDPVALGRAARQASVNRDPARDAAADVAANAAAEPPSVEISIGRIELRTLAPPAVPADPSAARRRNLTRGFAGYALLRAGVDRGRR